MGVGNDHAAETEAKVPSPVGKFRYGVINTVTLFCGLWLFPFGLLVIRSGFLPRILGVLLIANGFALLAVSLTALLLPASLQIVNRIAILPELGELWMMAWLLIMGAKQPEQICGEPAA